MVKTLLSRIFCQNCVRVNFSVEKREILSHWKKIREINYLVISFVKPLLSRNFCRICMRVNFSNFHTVLSTNILWFVVTDYLETADSNETIFLATFLVTFLTRDMVNTGKVKNLLRKNALFGCLNYSLLNKILAFQKKKKQL